MNAAVITAICTGAPAIIGAITALVVAIKANGKANTATTVANNASVVTTAHLQAHSNAPQ